MEDYWTDDFTPPYGLPVKRIYLEDADFDISPVSLPQLCRSLGAFFKAP